VKFSLEPPPAHSTGYWPWVWLLAVWALATACNLFKPYHIDDTAYLEMARWINVSPLHPMSGLLNWSGVDEPIHRTNHPLLYVYLMAIWGKMFGFSEPVMHALHSLPALAAILLFYRLARALAPSTALWTTAIIALGPAFVVGQNLMVDVPLLAAWLAFFNPLICDVPAKAQTRRYVLAGLACGAALLIKYSSLVLIPILWFSLLLERRRAQAWTALIPVATLGAWSLFNYLDYGGVHILNRPNASASPEFSLLNSGLEWFLALGALTPLGVIVLARAGTRWMKKEWIVYAAAVLALFAQAAAVALGILNDRRSDQLLRLAFAANAALICVVLARDLLALPRRLWQPAVAREAAPRLYLYLWIIGSTIFYIKFAVFIAARHVLLILPAVTLLVAMQWGSSLSIEARRFALAMTLVITIGIAIADWRFASFYRSEAAELARSLPKNSAIWASGHWGWQWYAMQNGLREFDVHASPVRSGDLLLVPGEVDHQMPEPSLGLRLLRTDTSEAPQWNLFCTSRGASFYMSPHRMGPWLLTHDCANHLQVFRVESVGTRVPLSGKKATAQ
jgi:4-amino-4-deoxy-L-arabinose transferase-like glycosyltransferase